MARMIPPYLSKDVKSPGERALFHKFQSDPGTSDWIVLHSLYVAKHGKRISGELDFVVLIPGEGVLCLEIKAGKVSRKDGVWFYGEGDGASTSKVGPFKQASDSMHAVRKFLSLEDSNLRNKLYFSAVIFTSIIFDEYSTEWHPWQFADRATLSNKSISKICKDFLSGSHTLISNTDSSFWYDKKMSRLSYDECLRVLELLRGDFEYFVSPKFEVEETIKLFTEEQFGALDLLEFNNRILFKGAAGTGKTFLAIEAARRLSSKGKKVLFLCYNRLLGDWLSSELKELENNEPDFVVGSLHKYFLSLSGSGSHDSLDREFWEKVLPENVLDRCLAGDVNAPAFDFLILDEAQDIISSHYLEVLDMLLFGGLAGGSWCIFGDFERQAIYFDDSQNADFNFLQTLQQLTPHHTVYPLSVNCRNDEYIAIGTELACGLQPGYSRYLKAGGRDISVYFYNSKNEQVDVLRKSIDQLVLREKFFDEDIVILSYKNDDECTAKTLCLEDNDPRFFPLKGSRKSNINSIGFTTIHSFKGMESSVVIITDISRITGSRYQNLLYVGMSRAKIKLVLLMNESCREDWSQIIQQSFSKMGGEDNGSKGKSRE